jgi:hypothetical protein
MYKVMFFLQRAEHLSLGEFRSWWLEVHAPVIRDALKPYLRRYVVNIREDRAPLPDGMAPDFDWDGVAVQWFDHEASFVKAYAESIPPGTREDTDAHTARRQRIAVSENSITIPA